MFDGEKSFLRPSITFLWLNQKQILMSAATATIDPLEDASGLGIATKEEAELLVEWKNTEFSSTVLIPAKRQTLNGLKNRNNPSPPPGGLFVCCVILSPTPIRRIQRALHRKYPHH